MTRSVEIPEAAVKAAELAAQAAYQGGVVGGRNHQMRAALEAALPYLVPAAADLAMTKAAHDYLANWKYNDVRISTDEAIAETMRLMKPSTPPAPVGDGGLREALEAGARDKIAEWYGAEWNASEDKFYETYDGGGISCVDDEAMLELRGVRLALDLALAARPAAPAVPQPVDREVGEKS